MPSNNSEWPSIHLPEAEAARLVESYEQAHVILEYGSGGSTLLGAGLPQKLVIAVESDCAWALRMQAHLACPSFPSPAIVHYVDIGPTGSWGRPVDSSNWQKFHRYPLSVWQERFFRHPDVGLRDGRVRWGCFAAILLQSSRPVSVLFDDYLDREVYRTVEKIVSPSRMVGRMAEFDLMPDLVTRENSAFIVSLFSEATYAEKHGQYSSTGFGHRLPKPIERTKKHGN